jgi:hypothetical protein
MGARHDPRSVGSEGLFPYPVGWSRFFGVAHSECMRTMGGVRSPDGMSAAPDACGSSSGLAVVRFAYDRQTSGDPQPARGW